MNLVIADSDFFHHFWKRISTGEVRLKKVQMHNMKHNKFLIIFSVLENCYNSQLKTVYTHCLISLNSPIYIPNYKVLKSIMQTAKNNACKLLADWFGTTYNAFYLFPIIL